MKTAISIPDDVFELAEELAGKLGVSRSELYTTAMRAMLADRRADAIRESYNAACTSAPTEEDRAWVAQSAKVLRRVEWK